MECPADTTLFALLRGDLQGDGLRRIDQHLDSCDSCRDVIATLARTSGAGASTPIEDELVPARGESIGRFFAIEAIGRGAMGVVFSAYDPQLDRKVAIKLLRPDHDGDPAEARGRLLREAQAMARLSHPNVVTVFEVGQWHEAVFVAMELVEGTTFRDWLAGANRDVESILGVLVQAGEGLAAAHSTGLVHRDFKPENVVVGTDGRAKVTDFGLAGIVASRDPSSSDADSADVSPERPADSRSDGESGARRVSAVVTRAGTLLGTPGYMAPEQLAGEAADARADQFAFAVTLFEALHGRRPFAGRTIGELRDAIESGSITRAVGSARVPKHVTAAIRRALSSNRDERFASIDALLAELRPRRSGRWIAAVAAGALVVAAAAAVGLAASNEPTPSCSDGATTVSRVWSASIAAAVATQLRLTPSGESIARTVVARLDRWARGFAEASDSVCRATRIERTQSESVMDARTACLRRQLVDAEAIVGQLGRPNAASPSAAVELVAALPDPSACADVSALAAVTPLPSDPAKRARIEAARARIAATRASVLARGRGGEVEAAMALVREVELLGYPPLVVEARLVVASALRGGARFDEAEPFAREALLTAEANRDDLGAARAWLALVAIEGEAGRYDEAARGVSHARAAVVRAGSPAELDASLSNVEGVAAEALGRHDEARRALERALELRKRLVGENDPEVARVLTNLGNAARARGDLASALRIHGEALEIDRRALGPEHPAVARHLHNLGGVLRMLGRPVEALDHYRRALAIRESTLGAAAPETAITRNSLGLVSLDLGRIADARSQFDSALGILSAASHAEEAVARHNLGLLDQAAGDHGGAVAHLTRALALEERLLGDRHEKVATIALELATSLIALGRHEEAAVAITRAEIIGTRAARPELIERAGAMRASLAAPSGRTTTRRVQRASAGGSATPDVPAPSTSGEAVPRAPLPSIRASDTGAVSRQPPERTVISRSPSPAARPAAAPRPTPAGTPVRTVRQPTPAPGGSTYTPGRAW